jgi:hypothetical protein
LQLGEASVLLELAAMVDPAAVQVQVKLVDQ